MTNTKKRCDLNETNKLEEKKKKRPTSSCEDFDNHIVCKGVILWSGDHWHKQQVKRTFIPMSPATHDVRHMQPGLTCDCVDDVRAGRENPTPRPKRSDSAACNSREALFSAEFVCLGLPTALFHDSSRASVCSEWMPPSCIAQPSHAQPWLQKACAVGIFWSNRGQTEWLPVSRGSRIHKP